MSIEGGQRKQSRRICEGFGVLCNSYYDTVLLPASTGQALILAPGCITTAQAPLSTNKQALMVNILGTLGFACSNNYYIDHFLMSRRRRTGCEESLGAWRVWLLLII